MTVTLYNNSSAYNTLYKSLTKIKDVTANIKGPCDVDAPDLILDCSSPSGFNYFYVADWGRYYRITSREVLPGDRMSISGVSDPVQSFCSGIAALHVLAARAEDLSLRSPELADNSIPLESDMQIDKITGDTVIGAGSGYIVIGVV